MNKYISNRYVIFDIEFRPADKASVHGGQLGVQALLKEFGLQKCVAKETALAPPRKQTGKGTIQWFTSSRFS